jgi:adenylate cyclase
MVAGSMGSAERLEYNVHGDTVNTAARLESFEKEGFVPDHLTSPCRILIGQRTLDLVGEQFATELVGEARLKGKQQDISIYRVSGRRDTKVVTEHDDKRAEMKPSSQAVSGAE